MNEARVIRWAIVILAALALLQFAAGARGATRTYDTNCWYRWTTDELLYCEAPVTFLRDEEVAPKPQKDPFDRRPRLAVAA